MFKKQWLYFSIFLLLIPFVVVLGQTIFADRSSIFISTTIAILAMIPFGLSFEKGRHSAHYLVILASFIAIAVLGRFLFIAVPGFKPVTAIVVIAAIYFGAEAGFLVGALAALISNIYFGQGPWTPFQMVAWGMVGFIAGQTFIRFKLQRNWLILAVYGIFSGVLFSLIMDLYTVFSIDGFFHLPRYLSFVSLSVPFMITYAISNVIFLFIMNKPFGNIIRRLQTKYGL